MVPGSLAGTGNVEGCAGTKISTAFQNLCDGRHKFSRVQRKVLELNPCPLNILSGTGKRLGIHFLYFKYLCS